VRDDLRSEFDSDRRGVGVLMSGGSKYVYPILKSDICFWFNAESISPSSERNRA
jgi:hypothetical protein